MLLLGFFDLLEDVLQLAVAGVFSSLAVLFHAQLFLVLQILQQALLFFCHSHRCSLLFLHSARQAADGTRRLPPVSGDSVPGASANMHRARHETAKKPPRTARVSARTAAQKAAAKVKFKFMKPLCRVEILTDFLYNENKV